jgi:LEA14-like dessication related protein
MDEKLLIHNPLLFNFTADSLQYKLFIGDVEVIKSTYTKSLLIRKWNSTWIDLPVTINNEKLLATLDKADQQGKDVSARATASIF